MHIDAAWGIQVTQAANTRSRPAVASLRLPTSQTGVGVGRSSRQRCLRCTGARRASAVAAVCVGLLASCAKETPEGLIQAARSHITEHDYRTAQIELKNAIRLAPNSGVGYRLLGTTFLETGDPVAAEAALRKALVLAERPDDVLLPLALALVRLGQSDRLTDDFGTRRLQDPAADASFQTTLGQAWLMRGDVKQADGAFAFALTDVPGYPPARLGQARVAALDGRIDDASRIANEVLVADPRSVEGHAFKAQLLMSQGYRDEASESLERAIAVDTRHLPARLALISLRIDGREYDKAQTTLGEANDPWAGHPRVSYLRSVLALRKGELQRARDEVTKILPQAPDDTAVLTLAGEIELRAGKLAAAEGMFQKVIYASPNAMAARKLLATTYLRQGRPNKAHSVLQPLLQQTGPKDTQVMMLVGEAYLANGDATRASEWFESSKLEVASEAAARLRLGQIALARGEFGRGIDELQAASAIDTEHHQADLLLVALHLHRNEPEKALAAAEGFLKKEPRNPLGYVLVGTARFAGKDLARARQSFDAAIRLETGYLPAVRGLAQVDTAEGHVGDAKLRYEALIAKKPDDEQLLLAFAELQERTGEVDRAGTLLRNAVKVNPSSPTPYAALVQYHLRRHDPKAAIAVAQDAADARPSEPRFLELLSDAQESVGVGEDAVRTYQAVVRLESQSLPMLIKLAAIQTKHRDFSGAATTLRQAQQVAPTREETARDLIAVYLSAGKFDEALGEAKALQVTKPRVAVGHALEGDVHAARHKWLDAERTYRTALGAEPGSSAIAIGLCRVLYASGRRAECAAFGRNWAARNPADLPMRMYLASVALTTKDYKTAAQHYEVALQHAPDSVQALNNLAWALGELKDPRALGFAERAVALAPNSPTVLDTMGMLQLQRGDPNKGLEYLARVRELASDRKDLHMHYAIGLLKVGRTHQGRSELRELSSSQEDFPGKSEIPGLLARP